MKKLILSCISLFLILLNLTGDNKTALVIGNGSYSHFPDLPNSRREAIEMKNALERLDFEVLLLLDGTENQIVDTLYDFEMKIKRRGGLALFHYGGHGIQVNDANYIIPVDANIPDERRVKAHAVDVDEVFAAMEISGSRTNIIILDACRDNPLPASTRSTSARGLAVIRNQLPDSIIVYAADAGTTAMDGLFTPTLLKYIETPGLELTDMLRKVRTDVRVASGGKQRTGEYNQLESEIFLAGRPEPAEAEVERAPAPTPDVEIPDSGGDMISIGGGTFSMGASNREEDERPVHSVTVNSFLMSPREVTQSEWQKVMGLSIRDQRDKAGASKPLKGVGDTYPVYYVSLEDAAEYCNRLSRAEDLVPAYSTVDGVIQCDFQASGFRLPTEAEWEYAARGGHLNEGNNYFSGNRSIGYVAWYKDNSNDHAHPVEDKQANELGIFDMSGNVREWCWDHYGEYGSASENNPVVINESSLRVTRGGSWFDEYSDCYVTSRAYARSSFRHYSVGFRVVRNPE